MTLLDSVPDLLEGSTTMEWFSPRFQKPVRLTRHAQERMLTRQIDPALMVDLVETGDARYKDEVRLWLYKAYPERDDNLICIAAALEASLVIKTVMHHWSLEADE